MAEPTATGLVHGEPDRFFPAAAAGSVEWSIRFNDGAAAGAELFWAGSACGTRCVVYAGTSLARCGVGRTHPADPAEVHLGPGVQVVRAVDVGVGPICSGRRNPTATREGMPSERPISAIAAANCLQ